MATSPTVPESLRVRPGQRIEAEHHNGLVRLAGAVTLQRGRMKGRSLPDGFTPAVQVAQKISVDHAFRMMVTEGEGAGGETEISVTFTPGHVSGIMPQIDDVGLDELDENALAPAMIVPEDAWTTRGMTERALVYFRYDLDASLRVTKVTPVALAAKPLTEPKVWHKLIGMLLRIDGNIRPVQLCFFSQYFDAAGNAAGNNAPGAFRAYPRAGA